MSAGGSHRLGADNPERTADNATQHQPTINAGAKRNDADHAAKRDANLADDAKPEHAIIDAGRVIVGRA